MRRWRPTSVSSASDRDGACLPGAVDIAKPRTEKPMSPIAIEADSPPQSRTFMRRFAGAPLPWIMPVIVVIGIFYLYPVIDVFRLSFTIRPGSH